MAESLPIPRAAETDPNSVELIRVWATNNNEVFSINGLVWSDPAIWGNVLVDLARNIAGAFEQNYDISFEDALAVVKKGFDIEWESPTDR